MRINEVTSKIRNKGYTLREFLKTINRTEDWYYKHSNGGKDYDFLIMAIDGLEDKK